MSLVEHCIAAKAKSQNDRAELSKKKITCSKSLEGFEFYRGEVIYCLSAYS